MKNYITEHQSPYLDLRAEVTDILFEGKPIVKSTEEC